MILVRNLSIGQMFNCITNNTLNNVINEAGADYMNRIDDSMINVITQIKNLWKSKHYVTSQHILYYCTYYSVSFTCTVHCTYYIYCTLYTQYMFPVSLFPMLRFHLQHLFTLLFTLICSKFTCVFTYHLCSHAFILTKLLSSA